MTKAAGRDDGLPHHGISFAEALRVWTRVAALSFGGPAGQIAVMHRILVDEKRLIGDARFETREARLKNEAELDKIITEFTSKRDKYECMRVIGAAVPAGAVRDTLELMNDPNFEERGIIQKIQHPTNGAFKMAGWPVRFNGKPPVVKPAPLLGQHSAEVLEDWLGMNAKQVAALQTEKVI